MNVFSNVLENTRKLSLFSKIIEHCHFVQNFTPVVVERLSKIQSSPSPEGYGHFQMFIVKKGIILREKNNKKIPFMRSFCCFKVFDGL